MVVRHYDPAGALELEVKVDPQQYARGCVAFTVSEAGAVDVLTQQDGTSDWIGIRVLPEIAQQVVLAALSFVNAPFEIIAAALDQEKTTPPPSPIHGCGGIFEEVAVSD